MKTSPPSRLSARYLAVLRAYLGQGLQASLEAARNFGTEAVAIGLETLDVAKIHDQALAKLLLPDDPAASRDDLTARAATFFTEAITPIEETHRAALEANADLQHLHATLDQRTLDLADSKRELQAQCAGRTAAQAALENSQRTSSQLLQDSRNLEAHLQDMARKVLSATEAERKKMSLQLNDEIAQILLGINLRMLALKKGAATNHENLTQEIATTQRLVQDSEKIIKRLAHEFSIQHEPPKD